MFWLNRVGNTSTQVLKLQLGLSLVCQDVSSFVKRNFTQNISTPLTGFSNQEIQKKRVALFDKEVKRQNALITDVEKIKVQYQGFPEDIAMMMNKNLSTPYDCALHVNRTVVQQSVLAEVDGELWDLFRPLPNDCTLRFLHFKEADPYHVNKAFWRSLSLMLGSVLETIFKDDIYVQLCSFPPPRVRSGSFMYDVNIPLESWEPSKDELRAFSSQMVKLALENKPFSRLEVDAKLALRMFEDNVYKKSQIPSIASKSESGQTVVLYRVGDFVDISRGPTVSHTRHMGKCSITGIFPFETEDELLYRVQGVALPSGFLMNHYTYSIIEERAKNVNSSSFPNTKSSYQRPATQISCD